MAPPLSMDDSPVIPSSYFDVQIQQNNILPNKIPSFQKGSSKISEQTICTDNNNNNNVHHDLENDDDVVVKDYSKRAQWLRAAVLGANDGLLSTASLMMGVGSVRTDVKTMTLTGIAGLIAGACSMAIGEYVSVYSQYDIEISQMKRERAADRMDENEYDAKKKDLPSPFQAAAASAFAFACGAAVPLLAAAFVRNYHVRLGVVVVASSFALLGFGGIGAFLGRANIVKSSLRVLFGGWAAMGITFGLTKLVGQKTGV
ncbi:OLC1v1002549C1 [Oldenlandia corymbosa var. corymbosa]|uniref:Vacuolar iron transporter n=1 Tax=Oldenlandia corymbosa var. corymbosa TaxID=529605 RepID=A0AAV1DAU3_OLDCO|nr:OLC1v1002549C1 [Oldenlandia corymbosa var. corymbosa]